jgi:hypothetical protein
MRMYMEILGKHKEISIKIAGIPVRVRTEHLPNTLLKSVAATLEHVDSNSNAFDLRSGGVRLRLSRRRSFVVSHSPSGE